MRTYEVYEQEIESRSAASGTSSARQLSHAPSHAGKRSRQHARGKHQASLYSLREDQALVWGFRVYLDTEEPTLLGFLLMISLYKSIKM